MSYVLDKQLGTNSCIYYPYHHRHWGIINDKLHLDDDILLVEPFENKSFTHFHDHVWKSSDNNICISWRRKRRLKNLWFTQLHIVNVRPRVGSFTFFFFLRGGGVGMGEGENKEKEKFILTPRWICQKKLFKTYWIEMYKSSYCHSLACALHYQSIHTHDGIWSS